ncbi:hypothetical protein JTE90_000671 [Oedothorax gibbosus]|uniref:Protein odr-4 homolog n=1 Tax=Oedothorax gibbosus TaxID=931172 RepID=A0AAV6VWX7_9ARAC|nr:hypothetical protein JTE90_000671 [Oedothorax gibbosus]
MGRIITFDNHVQETVNTITKAKTIHLGLIIGQCTEQKDIVLHLCPSPKKDEPPDSDTAAPKQSKNKSKDVIDLDEKWICQHAKQLLRTLPGGLDILGLYVVASADNSTKQQAQLRQILFAIYKTLGKSQSLDLCSHERVLLSICPTTFKVICRTYDIADFKCSANPADWKLQSGNVRWQRVRCQLAVDIKFPIQTENGTLSLRKQIEMGLQSFLENIKEAHALVNGLQRDVEDPLDASADSKKSKKKQADREDSSVLPQWHNIELFVPLKIKEIADPKVLDCVCMMTFKGAVQCRAYIHGKASVGDAINALKQDIVRSIIARCEIHCEDLLVIEEEQQDPLVVHELPRRVFAPLPQGDVCVCDYQFHSDTASDSLDAFKELLNLDLTEEDIDTSCEVSPTTSTLILPDAVEDRLSEFGDAPVKSSFNVYIPIAGVVATVAIGLASVYMASQSS